MTMIIFLLQLSLFISTNTYDLLFKNSIEIINKRYSNSKDRDSFDRFNQLSAQGSVRERFYTVVLAETKIISPNIVVEYSSSGETFSYSGVVIGYDKNKKLCRLDYNFYSNKEKVKIKRIGKTDSFNDSFLQVRQSDYDNQDKVQFPSDLMIVSYLDENKEWRF